MKMKKTILLTLSLLILGLLQAQVGINTTNPKGVFHVVAGSENIVITPDGNLGIGTLSPTSKFEIVSGTSATPANGFKLADGSQATGRALGCIDTDGRAQWVPLRGTWFASLEGGKVDYQSSFVATDIINFPNSSISNPAIGAVNQVTGKIRVPHTGVYVLTLTGSGHNNRVFANKSFIVTYFFVYVNGVAVWRPHNQYDSRTGVIDSSFIYYINLTANADISIKLQNTSMSYANACNKVDLFVEFMHAS